MAVLEWWGRRMGEKETTGKRGKRGRRGWGSEEEGREKEGRKVGTRGREKEGKGGR